MNKRLFVASLPFSCDETGLKNLFAPFGNVLSAKIITDRDTGMSKGFGFVEMENEEDALKAITTLNDSDLEGRKIAVAEAKPMEPKHDRFEKRGGFGYKKGSPARRTYGARREGGHGGFGRKGGFQ